jgi:uncharacterized protein YxjI
MLDRKTFVIREHVGVLKLRDAYDILDPDTQQQIGIAQEDPGSAILFLRLLIDKQMLPTKVFVFEGDNPEDRSRLRFSIQRGFTFLRAKVNVCDAEGRVIGWFKRKMMSLGGAFNVFNAQGEQIAAVKGNWKGWDFRFLDNDENEIGHISKEWAGMAKELFTSADTYVLTLKTEPTPETAALLVAAGLAVDIVFKES